MNDPTQVFSSHGRVLMARVAKGLNRATNGKLRPSHITTLSLLGHIPAAWALWTCRPVLAAGLIAVFASLDALDGALAREQGTASRLGMYYDAITDRVKEVIIYTALGVYLVQHVPDAGAWLAPALVGSSLLVSYVKAKGEAALSGASKDAQALNKAFSGGLARYEIRMVLLIVGLLLTDILPSLLQLIIALNVLTAVARFFEIGRVINIEDTKQKSAAKQPKKKSAVKKKG